MKNLCIDEVGAMLNFSLPIGEISFDFCVFLEKISLQQVRALRLRWVAYRETEEFFKSVCQKAQSKEKLEQAEKSLFQVKEFFLKLCSQIFLSSCVELKTEVFLGEEKYSFTKEKLSEWMQGDFLLVWGRLLSAHIEDKALELKKKVAN